MLLTRYARVDKMQKRSPCIQQAIVARVVRLELALKGKSAISFASLLVVFSGSSSNYMPYTKCLLRLRQSFRRGCANRATDDSIFSDIFFPFQPNDHGYFCCISRSLEARCVFLGAAHITRNGRTDFQRALQVPSLLNPLW